MTFWSDISTGDPKSSVQQEGVGEDSHTLLIWVIPSVMVTGLCFQ